MDVMCCDASQDQDKSERWLLNYDRHWFTVKDVATLMSVRRALKARQTTDSGVTEYSHTAFNDETGLRSPLDLERANEQIVFGACLVGTLEIQDTDSMLR